MSGVKITDLPDGSASISLADVVPMVQSGVTKQVPFSAIRLVTAAMEVDCHTGLTLTAQQVSGNTLHNYGQVASVNIILPALTANMSFLAQVASTLTGSPSYYWRFTAAVAGTIYLDGSATGKDWIEFVNPTLGNFMSMFSIRDGANSFRWIANTMNAALTTN